MFCFHNKLSTPAKCIELILLFFELTNLIMRKPVKPIFQQLSPHNAQIWGWTFSVFGVVFYLGFLYTAIVSKLLPPSDNPIVSAIQEDRYYCFLVPLSLPVLVVFIYFHWLSMKLFKHA